jgi:hypothetical protein
MATVMNDIATGAALLGDNRPALPLIVGGEGS